MTYYYRVYTSCSVLEINVSLSTYLNSTILICSHSLAIVHNKYLCWFKVPIYQAEKHKQIFWRSELHIKLIDLYKLNILIENFVEIFQIPSDITGHPCVEISDSLLLYSFPWLIALRSVQNSLRNKVQFNPPLATGFFIENSSSW